MNRKKTKTEEHKHNRKQGDFVSRRVVVHCTARINNYVMSSCNECWGTKKREKKKENYAASLVQDVD